MSIDDIRQLLLQTGYLDIIINPVESDPDILGTIGLYNGDYGTDLSGLVAFEFGTGAFNVKQFKRTFDMSQVVNKLWYYLGPKCDLQHWRGNVTGDDPYLPGAVPDIGGGSGVGGDIDYSNPLGDLRNQSIDLYRELMEIRIYDDYGGECLPDTEPNQGNNLFRPFYQRMWQNESMLRAMPRQLISWTPVRGIEPNFDVGDLIAVAWGPQVRGQSGNGVQRVYEFTVESDASGAASLTNLVTSSDGDQL